MLIIEGTHKNGQIVLTETPPDLTESKILVTFPNAKQINLRERGIGEKQTAAL